MWTCKHCKKDFDFSRTTDKANHGKHCAENPSRATFYDKLKRLTQARHNKTLGNISNFLVRCYSCDVEFTVKERENLFPTKQTYFCSRSCANSIGGRAKATKHHHDEVAHYTTVAWRHHEKKCLVCGEELVVAVHHYNENHNDNRPQNLVPLCPTHHQYMHSRHKHLIETKVNEYVKNKWG